MTVPVPQPGQVIRYAYLWAEEHAAGQEEGLKDRPCAIVLVVTQADETQRVVVLPITHSAPSADVVAIELPQRTKRQLRLNDERLWVVLSEANRFVWPGPDIRPMDTPSGRSIVYGFLPPSFFRQVRDRFLSLALEQKVRDVPRTE
jgi:hypothetical protein